jgi:RNA polymerase sigma factor (sigma-70 family)
MPSPETAQLPKITRHDNHRTILSPTRSRGRPRRRPHSVDRCAALDAAAAATSRSAAATVNRSAPIRATGRLDPHLDPVDGVSPDRRSAWRAPVGVDGVDPRFPARRDACRLPLVTAEEIGLFRLGDADAVRTVYRAYGRLVFAVARKVLRSHELAEEATQQTFVKAWRAAAGFDPSRDLGPWLATIARRTAIDLYRRESRRAASRLDEMSPAHPGVVELPYDIERSFEVWGIRQAITELPAEEAKVVRLQHLEGLTQTEIAERLGVPVGTVKSRSFRAHRHLAGRLGHLRRRDA